MPKRISLVLFDDNRRLPGSFASRIRSEPGFHLLAAAAELDVVLGRVRETRPELVVLNLCRWNGRRASLAAALHGASPDSRLVLMGLEPLHEDPASCIRAGTRGFIMADAPFEEVLDTLRSVAHGNQVLPPELAGRLFGQLTGKPTLDRRVVITARPLVLL